MVPDIPSIPASGYASAGIVTVADSGGFPWLQRKPPFDSTPMRSNRRPRALNFADVTNCDALKAAPFQPSILR